MDIYSDDAAEALWRFLNNKPEIYEDFCKKNEYDDISIIEYVTKYRLKEFKSWCLSELNIKIN